ncbi:uncharacterized protein LOC113349855 [Papaver somniferum]|uniref:uncharacterized protein LOC113349855 n=1 Tax=Papaver somniferum TaxID=3469 RepID=UPI000E6F4EA5|nr:uncharacterized protein LOC113349855 [Papaver somniferum]
MANFKGYSIREPVNRHGYQSDWLFGESNLGKVCYKWIVGTCLFLIFNSLHSVFDRGKEMSCIPTLDFTFGHQMNVWVMDFMLPGLITPNDIGDSSNLLVKLLQRRNYTNNLLLLLWVQIGGFHTVYKFLYCCEWLQFKMFAQNPEMLGNACSPLQLKCCQALMKLQLEALVLHVLIITMDPCNGFRSYIASVDRVSFHLLKVEYDELPSSIYHQVCSLDI